MKIDCKKGPIAAEEKEMFALMSAPPAQGWPTSRLAEGLVRAERRGVALAKSTGV